MPSVYRRLLGEKLDQWPEPLQAFHDLEEERTFTGTFKITRGTGWLRRFICWIGGLPPSGESVPVVLKVIPEGDREQWIRHFGKHQLQSVQWLDNGTLMEKLGPVTMAYKVTVDSHSFRLETSKAWLFGWIRMPLFLAPTGVGIETAIDNGVDVDVKAYGPLLGELVHYEGQIVIDPTDPGPSSP